MKKFKEIRNFCLLLAALLSILTIAALFVSNVFAKPITANPGNYWPTGTIWGTNLSLENGSYIGQAWYGVGMSEQKSLAPPDPPAGLIVEFLDDSGNNYAWVKSATAEPASYTWQVSLRTVGAAPDGGILRSTMSDVNNLYIPNDYSVVLDNQSGNGIFINLRAGAGTITGLKSGAKYATMYVDNAVNIQSIENLDPLTGNSGDQLRLRVIVKNTGRYTDDYTVSAGGSLDPTIFNLAPGNIDNVIVSTNLPNGTKTIGITAAGNYATDQDFITAIGSTTQTSRGIHLVVGWNLLAFPVVDDTTTPNKIFAPLVYNTDYLIYFWNAPGGPYSLQGSDSPLLDNTGYWVWINQDKTVTVASQLDNAWGYRRQITINNSGNLLENYQINIKVDYDGHMQTDFGDLRFVDGSTQLAYWIENYESGRSADVWVKIPSIPANDTKTIWMYYGNPSATSEENAKGTFIQYFDGNDYANWTVDAEHHVENSNGSLYIWSSPGDGLVCSRTFDDLTYNTSVEFKVQGVNISTNQRNFFILGDNGLYNRLAQIDYPEQNTKIEFYDNFSGNIDDTTGHKFSLWNHMSSETYYRIRITVRLDEGKYGVSVWDWDNRQLLGENTNVPFPLGSPNSFNRIYTGDGTYGVFPTQTCKENLTWIFIRKYIDPEPTVSLGSEERI